MRRPPPKLVFKIRENPTDERQPYALHHAETDEVVHVSDTPGRCSDYAFRTFGDGIEVRHVYLEGES